MKIHVISLGCNKNLVDTEVMLAHLGKAGCVLVDEPEEADCLLINTCSFLTEAVEESLDRIVELVQLKGDGKRRLVVTGCLVSRYGDEILKEIPEIDAVVPPTDLESVVEAVTGRAKGGRWRAEGGVTEKAKSNVQRPTSNEEGSPESRVHPPSHKATRDREFRELQTSNCKLQTPNIANPQSSIRNPKSEIEIRQTTDSQLSTLSSERSFPPRILSWPPHRAYLKIGEGCSNMCSYCLIPSIRGEFVSRDRVSLLAEMEYLVQSGVREVTLVAQDSGRYGTDRGEGSLPALIESLLSISGDYWLRVLYVHPKRVTDELLTIMGSDPRICRYLDIPFQHVSPLILEKMDRGDAPLPMEVVDKVRTFIPDVFLRTTLMTGFPGETDRDFDLLLDFLKDACIDHLGVFAYSREEGTAAARMGGQVDAGLAHERADILMREQAEISSGKLSGFVGQEMVVLVEDNDEDGPFGRHQGQAPEVDGVVRLDREVERGTFVKVRITDSDIYDLTGEILD